MPGLPVACSLPEVVQVWWGLTPTPASNQFVREINMAIDLRAATPTPSAAHLAPSAVQYPSVHAVGDDKQQQQQQSPPPDYDNQLEDALDKLDLYQSRRAQMDSHLKAVSLGAEAAGTYLCSEC